MQKKLLNLLADGNVHSGQVLGGELSVSRAAVCKQIRKLNELGLKVVSVKGSGYQLLSPIELLDSNEIIDQLAPQTKNLISAIDVHWSIESTNSHCHAYIKNNFTNGYVCLAEHQMNGRGRRGRKWVSPLAGNLYLSLVWRFTCGAETLEGFSLAVAIAVANALREDFSLQGVKLKWPNDILLDNKKIGGILIEIMGEAGGPCSVVVGIGINVSVSNVVENEIDQPWIDLNSALGRAISRNQLAASILNRLVSLLQIYERDGFSKFRKEWMKYDAFVCSNVIVQNGVDDFFEGVAHGISDSGELLVDSNGYLRAFKSGEVSLRRV
jgi:BirA family biotin operon repressor/biotin-[acetyl-CoA-carboxylase] ligase